MARHHGLVTPEKVPEFLSWLGQSRQGLAFDTETTGVEWDCRIRIVQFGDLDDAWVIPFEYNEPMQALVSDVLTNYKDAPLLAHNGSFDLHRLHNNGINVERFRRNMQDTMLITSFVYPDPPSKVLEYLYARTCGPDKNYKKAKNDFFKGPTKADLAVDIWETVGGTKSNAMAFATELQGGVRGKRLECSWDTVPLWAPPYLEYAQHDVIMTSHVYGVYMERLSTQGPWVTPALAFEHQCLQAVWKMEQRGFLVDTDYFTSLKEEWLANADTYAETLLTEWGVTSPGSGEAVAKALIANGWTPTEFTKTGRPKTSADVLEKVEHPIAALHRSYKKSIKWTSTYVTPMLEGQDKDGRVHPLIHSAGARTGRMSIEKPPVQQLPKSNPVIRRGVIAQPGHSLVSVDYDAMELVYAAAMSGEPGLVAAIKRGDDLHAYSAAQALGKEDISKLERDLGKTSNYLELYGGGPSKLAASVGVSLEAAVDFLAKKRASFPKLREYTKGIQTRAKRQHYVTTPRGRRLPVDPGHEYAAVNYVIQGACAEVLKNVILNMEIDGLSGYTLLPVHDELLFEVPDGQAEAFCQEVTKYMEWPLGELTLTTGGKMLGHSWGTIVGEQHETGI